MLRWSKFPCPEQAGHNPLAPIDVRERRRLVTVGPVVGGLDPVGVPGVLDVPPGILCLTTCGFYLGRRIGLSCCITMEISRQVASVESAS
jgi:hypothetical protein